MANLLLTPEIWDTEAASFADGVWSITMGATFSEFPIFFMETVSVTAQDTVSGSMDFIIEPGDHRAQPGYLIVIQGNVVTDSYQLWEAGATPGDQVVGSLEIDYVSNGADFIALVVSSSPSEEVSPVSYDSPGTLSIQATAPAVVSYNCECDDEYPTRTLAQMREYLMIRLGWGAMVSTPLPGVAVTLNSFLRDAQEQIYRQYKVFRLERFFTWQLVEGVRFYDLPENEDVCTKKLDPRMITWVGISQGDNFWRQLVCGIKPEFYYGDISSWPTHYEIRQCIEVWPPPSSDDWKLRIKGYFGLLPLEEDTDVNTIDYEAIQLFALANAKAHYGQPDAANYMQQYRDYIGAVTAGSHHTRRYVPNTDQAYPPPLPILTGYPGDP